MKYLCIVMGLVFSGIVFYKFFAKGAWDSTNSLWSLVMFLYARVEILEEKRK